MKRMIKLAMVAVCMIMIHTTARADINYNLIYHWSYQPPNVQQDLVNKHTSIQVVPDLAWYSPDLYDTYAYTTMHVVPGTLYVNSIDIFIKEGMEAALAVV